MASRRADYLVCYDIADPKRLAKVARYLERRLFRIQYSIFIAKDFGKEDIYLIADALEQLIDPREDDIRIYTIQESGIAIGAAYDLDEIFIIR